MDKLLLMILAFATTATCITELSGNFSAGSRSFTLDLYTSVARETFDNVVISPISIETILGLLYMGANGSTASEIGKIMNFDPNKNVTAYKFKSLFEHYADSETIQIAIKMYLNESIKVKTDFSTLSKEKFCSEVENINTRNGSRFAEAVNSWVESKTNKSITTLVSKDDVEGVSSVLASAIYFRAKWTTPFEARDTLQRDFWISKDESKQVDMMYRISVISYAEIDDFKAIRLPYENSSLSFVIVLPNERDGFERLESHFREHNAIVRTLLNTFKDEPTTLYLPKFKTDTELELSSVLQALGLAETFSSHADYSELTTGKLQIEKVIHKAVIEVDEEGTEEGDPITHKLSSRGEVFLSPPNEFNANHPFLYFVLDSNGHIFFMGRYVR